MTEHTKLTIDQDNRPPDISEQEAQVLHDTIQKCIALITYTVVEMGEALQRMKESGGYKHYFDTWEQYKASLDIQRATIHCYMRIADLYRQRIVYLTDRNDVNMFLNTPWTKISEITPMLLEKNSGGEWVRNDTVLVHWLHEAHTQLRDELRENVKMALGKPSVNAISGVGIFRKLINDNVGKTTEIQMTQCRLKYNVSNQNLWGLFGNRKVKFIIRLCETDE